MPDSAAPSPPNLQDPVTLLLINGTTVEQAESFCVTRGLNPTDAKAIVGEARKRITVAADYARDEQIGVAFMRLNDLYSKSVVAQDYRTALAAQKELSRTLSLYAIPGKAASGDQGGADAQTLRNQLERRLPPATQSDRKSISH